MTWQAVRHKPGLVQASGLLFVMLMGNNLCNYIFHALASRRLGPADYGALVSMLALLTVLAIPSQAIQTVLARRVSLEELAGRSDRIAALAWQALWRVLLLGLVAWAVLALNRSRVHDFFHLASMGPVLAVGLTVLVMLATPVVRGVLQGLQQFGHLGANTFADGMIRLGAGAVFLAVGWGVTGGVAASALGGGAALLAGLIPLRWMARQPAVPAARLELDELYRDVVPVMLTLGAYLVLSSADVLLVKHFFEPTLAGYYAAGSLVGKAFLFLPLSMAHVLFPKVSVGQAQAENTFHLLQKSLWLTGLIVLAAVLAVWLAAPLIVWTLFGRAFTNPMTLTLVRYVGLAMGPLALSYILVQYHLALQGSRFLMVLLADIPVLVFALAIWHPSLTGVLVVVGVNHALTLGVGYWVTPRQPRPVMPPAETAG